VEQLQPISILLIEEDDNSCEIISSMLALKFPEAMLHTAGNWHTGLDSFRRYQPGIVIIDSNLSEIDGLRILDSMPEIKPFTRLILYTSHCNSSYLERISLSGVAVELVPRPIDFEILFASITRCIASLSAHEINLKQL
jgi:DNA-binding NtrC family response regulator